MMLVLLLIVQSNPSSAPIFPELTMWWRKPGKKSRGTSGGLVGLHMSFLLLILWMKKLKDSSVVARWWKEKPVDVDCWTFKDLLPLLHLNPGCRTVDVERLSGCGDFLIWLKDDFVIVYPCDPPDPNPVFHSPQLWHLPNAHSGSSIPGQCDCLDCILPMIASLALHTWSVGLPCQDASAAHDAPSPRDTGLDLPLIPPRLIQTALSWSGLLCPSWKPRDKSTNSRWRWSNRFCPGLLLSGAWRESHLRQFCQHQSPYTVPRRTPSSLPGHSLESASPPQPRGVQIPQHWNFQDATKNCGCTSPGSPKTPWVESHTSKMTLRIAFEFLPF